MDSYIEPVKLAGFNKNLQTSPMMYASALEVEGANGELVHRLLSPRGQKSIWPKAKPSNVLRVPEGSASSSGARGSTAHPDNGLPVSGEAAEEDPLCLNTDTADIEMSPLALGDWRNFYARLTSIRGIFDDPVQAAQLNSALQMAMLISLGLSFVCIVLVGVGTLYVDTDVRFSGPFALIHALRWLTLPLGIICVLKSAMVVAEMVVYRRRLSNETYSAPGDAADPMFGRCGSHHVVSQAVQHITWEFVSFAFLVMGYATFLSPKSALITPFLTLAWTFLSCLYCFFSFGAIPSWLPWTASARLLMVQGSMLLIYASIFVMIGHNVVRQVLLRSSN